MKPEVIDMQAETIDRSQETITTVDLASAHAPTMRDGGAGQPSSNMPLFTSNDAQDFRTRWEKIQTSFVDEPRKSVEQADELVAAAIKRLAEMFAGERERLEAEWDKRDNVSTEDLRVALRRYRSFFDRLLSV